MKAVQVLAQYTLKIVKETNVEKRQNTIKPAFKNLDFSKLLED